MPKNREELIETMQRKWKGTFVDMLEVLISPMPHRMNDVICHGRRSTR